MSRPYEGDISVQDTWARMEGGDGGFLIDVRTAAEWAFVGVPLTPAGSQPALFAEWQSYPSMAVDPGFAERVGAAITAAGGTQDTPLYFLCRSGARSQASAAALTAAGFRHCFNIESGFEGPTDEEGHRGRVAGWKAAGLPWMQK